jgi:hypothetical protein
VKRSPAQVYAVVFGVTLTFAGIVGFFYTADFSTGSGASDPANVDPVFGLLDVNGWHNVVHLLTGVLGLGAASDWFRSRLYAWGLGIVYLGVAAWGFAIGSGEAILGIVPVNTEDNILHLSIAVLGLGAALATPSAPRPTLAPGNVEREHVPALDQMA